MMHCSALHSRSLSNKTNRYPGAEYNARVYKQRCRRCGALGDLFVENGGPYAERVAYRIKKWCGVKMEAPTYIVKKTKRPHEKELCEGCKAGHCPEGGFDDFS